jgi:type I restriction enzyme S subunit
MSGDWQAVPFERLLVEPVRNGIYKTKEFHGQGVKIVNMGELFANPRLRSVPMKRVQLSASEIERFSIAEGDLIFARRSLTAEGAGKCSVVLEVDEPTTFESSIIRGRPDRVKVEPLYLYYFFNSPAGFQCLDTIRRQVAVAGITGRDLSRLEIPLPSLVEQRAISQILGSLDDKIELNRLMSETLDDMTRTVFKSWFMNFEPVRAKAEGRDPSMPKHLADLFPKRLVPSELGEIPEGWGVRGISDVADVIYGAPFSSAHFNSDAVGEPLIRIRDLPSESPGVWTPEVHPKGYKVLSGDIVVGMDGEFRAYLWGGAKGWLNQRVCVFKPKPGSSAAFVRNVIMQPLADIEATESATTVIHLGKSDIDRFRFVLPSADVAEHFNALCQPWYDRIVEAKRESSTLAALRDGLQPKLVTGELRLRDAEKLVATVA